MTPQTLCSDVLSVVIDGSGDRTILEVRGRTAARFVCHTADLEQALNGVRVQVSAEDSFCVIARSGSEIRLEFATPDEGRHSCVFPAEELRDALDRVRATERTEP